jgi:hypothetical protein
VRRSSNQTPPTLSDEFGRILENSALRKYASTITTALEQASQTERQQMKKNALILSAEGSDYRHSSRVYAAS